MSQLIPAPVSGASLEIRDEGTPQGTADTLDVTGAAASVSVTGGVATINVTASANAEDITVTPAGNLGSTDVQAALEELQGDVDTHLADTVDAHDASAISVSPTGNLASTTVQAALQELQGDVDTLNAGASSGVAGAIQYSNGSGGFSSEDANLHYDATNNRLGIGCTDPESVVEIINPNGSPITAGTLRISNSVGGTNSRADLDLSTYRVSGGTSPTAKITAIDNGDYTCSLKIQTKATGSAANALVDRLTISDTGLVTVPNTIYSSSGGFKFPDNTTQTTAASAFSGITVKDEGSTQGVGSDVTTLNFVGSMVAAAVSGSTGTVTLTTPVASGITSSASGNLSSTNVQDALQELQGDIDTLTAGGAGVTCKDEGVSLGLGTTLDFTGSGVTASIVSGTVTVNVPGGGSVDIKEEGGSSLGSVSTLDFYGPNVTAAVSGSTGTVTVNTGGASRAYAATSGVSPTKTISSSTPATINTASFTQTEANQKITVIAAGSLYTTSAGGTFTISVQYDGGTPTGHVSALVPVTSAGPHYPWCFVFHFTGAATTGSKTVDVQWARTAGSGTGNIDSNDSLSMVVF